MSSNQWTKYFPSWVWVTRWRRGCRSGGRDSHPAEESRAWKMSLSANFPEEPWRRLRAGNGKCAGRRRQPHPSGEAVCKVLLKEARGVSGGWGWGVLGLEWGERNSSGRLRTWHLPKAWSPGRGGAGLPSFLLPPWAPPRWQLLLCPAHLSGHRPSWN